MSLADAFRTLPELRTAALHLRALTPADLDAVWPITFYGGRPAATPAEARGMLAQIEQDYRDQKLLHWALALAATGELVGTAGFYRGFADRTGEIGYVLLPAYRGRGLMTEAVQALCALGFGQLGLRQIVAYTDTANAASQQVLLRAGFARAGTKDEWLRYLLQPEQP
ncbi:GNAT family N-acetyltransferase [Hymenobacter sp. 15J16-1T3B]|uniref:GNAT family N-acetyltransferase n=1 Tax=Hymenobacter sp. 15J16-1T3B TaxID=2886941 RepID=UPI001D0F6661|nr:GNAT family N-acetyltransferase [Hymenobacter sp. 15J16-1T3B]MCC3156590.1 GNAT family N-acetyltransferase [Hymenobacter sp. 15J16-1T3B]